MCIINVIDGIRFILHVFLSDSKANLSENTESCRSEQYFDNELSCLRDYNLILTI